MKEGYKKTELGWIPEDWCIEKIRTIAEYIGRGKSPEYTEHSNFMVINQATIHWHGFNFNNMKFVTKEFWENLTESTKLKEGDLLINSTGTGTLGRVCYCSNNVTHNYTYDSHVTKIRFSNNSFHSKYFFFYFSSNKFQKEIYTHCISGSTNQIEPSRESFKERKILIPPLPEQKKIADILSTVDEKIESIEQQIEQTEELKKGLMQRLFTQGIGHTEFKDTEIGRIPKEWEVRSLKDLILLKRGFDITQKEQTEGKFPVVSSSGITSFHNAYKVEAPGLVIGRKGSIGLIFFLECNFWPHDTTLWVEDFKGNEPKYAYYFLHHFNLKKYGTKTGAPSLNRNDIHPIPIPLPPLPEQHRIASLLSTVDDKLQLLHTKKSQYTSLEKGLMQKLLTGQIRVKV